MPIDVASGTIAVYTDVACGWATVGLTRLYAARERARVQDRLRVDHRLFLLEDVNRFPIPKRYLDAEIPVVGHLEPQLEFKPWQQDPSAWPVTTAPANEAVHAAKAQSYAAAEQLDMALRLAFFRDSRCISLQHEILDVASGCDQVDTDALAEALDTGSARASMIRDYREHRDEIQGSPHFFLADGTDTHNPGIELRWEGEPGAGYPVVEHDDPHAYDTLVQQALK
ncbi:DsbA family protein [Streptomyces sp. NBC_00237]|uniref:DsbA family oxidoreductase n=1 Tax=Streptomyces sp. NBC_00237 TaxID=2975687 RepID=UPI00224DC228|nr:DsbA family protein [Streptomyces sp. NBC_00237]MCX5205545.1 DsbA family protein [Streptomyces sp. NBC_00237]